MKFYQKRMKLFSSIAMLCISILSYSQILTPPEFHDTKGNIDVDGGGQLQFSLPIALPPGIKDVAPSVNLVYSSGSFNGLAGYGWNIAGISSISRGGRDIEKDGELKGVQLNNTDTYNFNGQRLILKSGEYGKDGAEYVTEKFSNFKIKSIGSITGQAWSGPEYWEVTSPDGSQTWYGATSTGSSTARTPLDYNIVKWKDAQGNYITYNYLQDAGSNTSIISSIKWGGNETIGKAHINEVVFSYNETTSRTLVEQSYVRGVSFIQDKLLNKIVVKTNAAQYKKYEIIYRTDATKYHFVDRIQEFNAENQPATPIEVFSQENRYFGTSTNHFSGGDYVNFQNLVMTGDFLGYNRLNFVIRKNGDSSYPAGYYIQEDLSSPRYYLGSENVFENASTITVKDADGVVRSKQGIVSYSLNPTTRDITLKYYVIDLTKLITSTNVPNSLTLISTKIIPKSQWDQTEHTSTINGTSYHFLDKTSALQKIIPYDIDGDGVPEVLLEKTNTISNSYCTNDVNEPLDPLGRPRNCQINTTDETKYIVVKQQDDSFPFFEFYFDKSKDILFADFNGDGIDDIARSAITYNTTLEGESVPEYTLYAYNIKKDDQGNLGLTQAYSADYSGRSSTVQIGDFNGDGLPDLFTRTNNNGHYVINMNTGLTFLKLPYFNNFNNTEEYVTQQDGHYSTVRVLDINADGKSDIINYMSNYLIVSSQSAANTYSTVNVSENHGYLNGRIHFESTASSISQTNRPVFYREILGVRQNQFCIYYGSGSTNGNGAILEFNHYANLSTRPINRIKQGGITTTINYDSQYDYNYSGFKKVQYPLMEIDRLNSTLVTAIYSGGNQTSRGKQFKYRGLVINLHSKKPVGFQRKAVTNWFSYGFENAKIWSGTETDPTNEGVPVKEWSIRTNVEDNIFPTDLSENNGLLLSFKSTIYQKDKLLNGQVITTIPDAEKANVVTAILPKITRAKDFLTGSLTENTLNYGDHYLPVQTEAKVNNSFALKTTNYLYDNSPSGVGADYYIGRLTSKTEIAQAYNDTQSVKEDYTYENNQIKTVKAWNRDNTGYVLNTFFYDDFGNTIQKVTSNSVDGQTESTTNSYDVTGRFVNKITDNLNLETNTTYNEWGQILTQTDPLGITLTNTYDGWGKPLTSSSNLGGTTTYNYEKGTDYNVLVTQNTPDGNISKTWSDMWGQTYKTSTKAFGQGQFVSKNSKYDQLGRKIAESEPYFDGQSASVWNVITYDDTFYPAKIRTTGLATLNSSNVVTSFAGKRVETITTGLTTTSTEVNNNNKTTYKTSDFLGNLVSSTDKGGTVQFSYNAVGQQIKAQYAENIVTTKYDVWGRKSEFNDPANGLYKYEYDGLGQAKKTISPKGTKEFTYNNLGQLVSQTEYSTIDGGQTTNKTITYTYNNKGIVTSRAGTVQGEGYSTILTHDTYGRLLSSVENSNGKTYKKSGITYDDKNRVISLEKELLSNGISTKVTLENVYSTWNGDLYQIKDKPSGKVLWELKQTNAKGLMLNSTLGAANILNTYDANGFLSTVNHSSAVKPSIIQLSYSFDGIKNELKNRTTGGDFNIVESFDYDDNNRLVNWTNPVTGIKPGSNRNTYDLKGRILENDQVGIMNYENSAKIYQQTGMTLNTNGQENYNGDLIQSITYNENNDPVQINGEKYRVSFNYGLGSMRQRVNISMLKNIGGGEEPPVGEFRTPPDNDVILPVWQNTFAKFYNEEGDFEVIADRSSGKEKHIIYIEGSPYEADIVYLKDFTATEGSYKFLHKDYLGSILAISDEAGNRLEQRHFDAWGNFTHLKIGSEPIITNKALINEKILALDRGYTSHEHFMEVGIIHMNGRLYDPLLRRFLNADENIQEPTNTQNYNKYGYVLNNPMMYNDPNGEFLGWLIGTIVGSYLSGVQANNGNFNPVKWDWKSTSTWTSVIGGGIAGAAIGQGIENISVSGTKFVQSSVVGAVGSIFNGLSTGQNIFKSALIGFAGISTTIDVFAGNKLTSTDSFADRNKYIISPDYNEGYEGADYLTGPGPRHPFSRSEINMLWSGGIITAVTAKAMLSTIALEGAGAGAITAGAATSSMTWGSFASILTKALSIGAVLSIKDDAPPQRYYVYGIAGREEMAKFGITRRNDPTTRPQSQIAGLNRDYSQYGPHSWRFLQGPVDRNTALIYEKYYVWAYTQNAGTMPYAQRYPYADAIERFIKKNK